MSKDYNRIYFAVSFQTEAESVPVSSGDGMFFGYNTALLTGQVDVGVFF